MIEFTKNVVGFILAIAFVEGFAKPSIVWTTNRLFKLMVRFCLNKLDQLLVESSYREEWLSKGRTTFILDYILNKVPLPGKVEVAIATALAFNPKIFEQKTGVSYGK